MADYDDHMSSVSNASGNVLYKAAGRAFLVNGGAGMNITNNLLVNGGQGIYNMAGDDMTADLPLYDNGTLKRGDKSDYIWKTEQQLGIKSYAEIFSTPFAKRFPTFAKLLSVNSTTAGWASPALSRFTGNVFLNNSVGNICVSIGGRTGLRCDAELLNSSAHGKPLTSFIDTAGSGEGEWAWFPGSASLEFVNASLGFDTTKAGLHCNDGFRRSLPVKSLYRPWVKQRFDGVPSAAVGEYTPEAAAVRAGLRSGQALLLNFSSPCPATAPKSDCEGIWLAWGECELDSHEQVVRFTVEVEPAGGGKPCTHLDGTAARRPC